MHITYTPNSVCTQKIEFDLAEDHTVSNVKFTGGCPGNLLAISKMSAGQKAETLIGILEGNPCGRRATSCADQFAKALKQALSELAGV